MLVRCVFIRFLRDDARERRSFLRESVIDPEQARMQSPVNHGWEMQTDKRSTRRVSIFSAALTRSVAILIEEEAIRSICGQGGYLR